MRRWWIAVLLVASTAHGKPWNWPRWFAGPWFESSFNNSDLPCSAGLLTQLFRSASLRTQFSRASFLKFTAEMPPRFGLPPELVRSRYQALIDSPELAELMGGFALPESISSQVTVSGAWGADYNFLPNYTHWKKVRDNLPGLVDRMGRRLNLDPILEHQLFAADETSVSDSGWVIVSSVNGKEKIDSSIKITFFDYDTTPDGGWPRYYFASILPGAPTFLHFRRPRELSDFESNLILEGFFSLHSSLDYWGLFPSELETGYRFTEHENLFSSDYLREHRSLMTDLLDHFGQPDVAEVFKKVQELRTRIPDSAREMAELQRFNIPPGAHPASKAQIFYGLTVLLSRRPIKTLVALSPRPAPLPGQTPYHPSWEVAFAAPGYEELANIARRVGEQMDREKGIVPVPLPDPEHDLLKEMYEGLGLRSVVTIPYVRGLPNGAHLYRGSRDRFLRNIILYQEKHSQYLTSAQLKTIAVVKEGLSHEE